MACDTNRHWSRRSLLAGLGALALAGPSRAAAHLDASELGLVPNSGVDQTAAMNDALRAAREQRRALFLPGGLYRFDAVEVPGGVAVIGVPGQTKIEAGGAGPALTISGGVGVTLDGLQIFGAIAPDRGLIEIVESREVRITGCDLNDSGGSGVVARKSTVTIDHCEIRGHAIAGIHSTDSRRLMITNCRVWICGQAGIRIWGSEPGHEDRSIVSGNVIQNIRWDGGGNGQNGNGINIFRADGVIVADNQISDCAFTAVRLNATNNTQVRGNTCLRSGEVAIFSEFGFSGSIIADNIVDGAAGGISMANFDSGGRLATCTGNIVRNITPRSAVNPDTTPFGIFAEADALIADNVVEAVPGVGISAGWGPYLRDVLVTGNLVRACSIGIGVSVAEGAGKAVVTGNRVSGAGSAGIAGLAWFDTISDDLVRDAARFANVTLSGNSVG